jgi:hypothetical protein
MALSAPSPAPGHRSISDSWRFTGDSQPTVLPNPATGKEAGNSRPARGLAGCIDNDRYQQIAVVRAGSGYATDWHEFLITP